LEEVVAEVAFAVEVVVAAQYCCSLVSCSRQTPITLYQSVMVLISAQVMASGLVLEEETLPCPIQPTFCSGPKAAEAAGTSLPHALLDSTEVLEEAAVEQTIRVLHWVVLLQQII